MAYVTFEDHGGYRDTAARAVKVEAGLKIASLFGFVVILLVFLLVRRVWLRPGIKTVSIKNGIGGLEYVTPYKNTLYENFGFVQDPRLTLPLKTLNGYVETTFLLDSGAVVSTLPLQAAREMGIDLTKAKRITLQGFSGIPSFAYLDKITLRIGESEYDLPASFSESAATTYILGRKGFFDDFSILFDHEQRAIIITRKGR